MVQESIKELRFVDLFAGLGGFHLALSDLGHKCVFACEIQKELDKFLLKMFLDTKYFVQVFPVNPFRRQVSRKG